MKYGQIEGIDKPVSRLVQGTVMLSEENVEENIELLDGLLEIGCNSFDTAHIYAGGQAERVLGTWMDRRGVREKVFILSKGAHHNADRRRVTSYDVASDLFDSLARLKTDYIDLYMLNRDDLSLPVGPMVENLNEHLEAGRFRAIGGSNWTVERIQEANEYAEKHGLVKFAASSPNFTLATEIEPPWAECLSIAGDTGAAARTWYGEKKMPLFTWSSLAQGFLSGRLTKENRDTMREELSDSCVQAYWSEENFERLDRAGKLALERGVLVPQIALAFMLNHKDLDVFPLTGCASVAEFETNMIALDLKLNREEIEWLDLKSESRRTAGERGAEVRRRRSIG